MSLLESFKASPISLECRSAKSIMYTSLVYPDLRIEVYLYGEMVAIILPPSL
jgi:hypothetical protein